MCVYSTAPSSKIYTSQLKKGKKKKGLSFSYFFNSILIYIRQVFLTRCHSTKRGKKQSTNYIGNHIFFLLLLFTVIKHSERNCLLSRLEMAGSETRNRGIHGNTLFLFIPIPKSKKKKKCRHINSDDGAMLEEEMIVELLPLFCVWRKKKKRDNIEIASRSAQFLCVFSFEDVGKKTHQKTRKFGCHILCVDQNWPSTTKEKR